MTIAQRIREVRARVREGERELQGLREIFIFHHVTRKREARALYAMRKTLEGVSARLENMAKEFDPPGFT